jgi:rhamnosyltransferase
MNINIYSISVTFNPDIPLLERQIDSLDGQVKKILIVDNDSSNRDELETFLAKKAKATGTELVFLTNGKNMGLGFAQNYGIRYAIDKGASDVLLLDQDSVLTEGFINSMSTTRNHLIAEGVNVGAIGPVYFNEVTKQVYPITKYKGPFIKRLKPTDKPEEASFLIASGCFISVDVVKIVGLMNEELFIDCIDVDWSFRAQEKGYKLFADPTATMMHTIGEKRMKVAGRSIAVHSPLRRYYLFRNSVFMVRSKNIPIGYKIREIAFNAFRLIVYFSASKDRLRYLKYSFRGFWDGIKGVGGECTHKF